MASTTRQNSLLVNQDWTKVYESFRNADFQSYDFQTLRKSMIDYLRIYYPEDFNDFTESSEFIALVDMIAFLGQSLAFRTDLNARENFIDTAERRDSVLKLARLVSYVPKRNQAATGFLKFDSVQTTETLRDSNGIDLSNLIIRWSDSTNINWYEQFVTVLNAAMPTNQQVGRPAASKKIASIVNEEYNLNLPPGTTPLYKFQTQIENATLPFEIVSPTMLNQDYIYEAPPVVGAPLNILYRNDNQGNASNNTGFFVYFKQGTLQNSDFTIVESIPNNVISINYDNINNTDVWLFGLNASGIIADQWSQVPNVNGMNIIYNNNSAKKSYQVSSRNNDQIDLIFGDGSFGAIPQGSYRSYFRTSAGLSYKITPDEMQGIVINLPYISKIGRLETLTITASLRYTVANALARESVADIKTKAPQLYYTQNRMVTAEDYNTFPYASFSQISKAKAVNRTSSGISRFLDVKDTTGRYSSTNIFADDGILYREYDTTTIDFTWNTSADINRVIQNQILPQVRSQTLLHFYYEKFTRFNLTNLYWNRSTVGTSSSTGYFVDNNDNAQQIGSNVTGNNGYINPNSIVIFSPGTGNYFNSANEILPLPQSGLVPSNGKSLIYVTLTNLISNGSQGNLSNGQGPVSLNENVPTGAQAITVIPAFSNTFSTELQSQIISLITSYTEFGLRYDQLTRTFKVVTAQNIDTISPFSQTNQGSITNQNLDSSWLINFSVTGKIYHSEIRKLTYIFESTSETKFYFSGATKIFDPVTGLTVNDSINVLKINGDPDTNYPLESDVNWFIYNQAVESDGYVDSSKVLVTYADRNDDGVPDNPDIFNLVVEPNVNADTKLVYFIKNYGYNNFVLYEPVDNALVNSSYATKIDILPAINNYAEGQLFYTTQEGAFYILTVSGTERTLVASTEYIARIGRQSLYFQYKHNSPGSNRLDPSPNNLIDLYVLTKEYEADYRAWALDTTGLVDKPTAPNSEDLRLEFSTLENFKSVSDAIIYNAARFKPLFGNKASSELQATFKVIKNANITLSDSEIRSQVLAYINAFFATTNWDFGETFYFTELATYVQQRMAPAISSMIIVPNSTSQVYGSLQQIGSQPDEILISVATVQNIEVISSITAAQINQQNSAVNILIN